MESLGPSLTDSSEFDGLPPATPVVDLPPSPDPKDQTPTDKICPACDKPIYREPGTRGRLPRYHVECRPSGARRVLGGTSAKGRNTKAESEAEQAVTLFKGVMVKFAMALAMVDKYDGFCIMSALPGACDNLKGVLVQYPSVRKDMLAIRSGGSVVGFIFSLLLMGVPIAAHHGLIPSTKVAEMLTQLPIVMHKIATRIREGETALTDMMQRAAEGMLKTEDMSKPNAADDTGD